MGASREDRGVKSGSREERIEGQLSSCAADMESKKEVNTGPVGKGIYVFKVPNE